MTSRALSSPPTRRPQQSTTDPAAPAILTVDLGALCGNYRLLRARAAPAECAAVVKADAYGTGAVEAATALAGAGCRTFFVATLGEAWAIRGAIGESALYVLDGLFPDAAPGFAEIEARPVLGSLPEVEEWAAFCRVDGVRRPAAIHIDTGMNRLGLRVDDVEKLAGLPELRDGFAPTLVMSHLACADDPLNPMNEAQRVAFDTARAKLPPMPASFANSGGVFLGPEYHYDLVRPGVALYGGRAVNGVPNPMRPVVRLDARIAQLREARAGETVGYGATRSLARPTRIATLAAGYADGLFRYLGAPDAQRGLTAYVSGHPAPILGRVSMDTVTVDVTDVPANLIRRGALVELLGDHVTVDDLAARAGTIGYEVLTALGRRYERVYLAAGEAAG